MSLMTRYRVRQRTRVHLLEHGRRGILRDLDWFLLVAAVGLTTLGSLLDEPVDMLTTVVIGNSSTERLGGRLFTRRGYAGKWAGDAASGDTATPDRKSTRLNSSH